MRQVQVFSDSLYCTKDSDPPRRGTLEEEVDVATQKTRAVTIQVNGAEWLDVDARARAVELTIPAYVRTACGLAAWLTRGAEMAGRTSSARRPTLALERRSITIPLTDQEHEQLAGEARQAGIRLGQYIRTRCGLMVRETSLPGTDERGNEEDDAWERLKRLGLNPEEYFPAEE